MNRLLLALLMPVGVVAFVVIGVVAIGSLLLAVGHDWSIPVALSLTALVTIVASFLATRPVGPAR